MKKLLFLLFFVTSLFSAEPATKEDIAMIIKMMEVNQEAINKRFEALDKRIDAVEKRIDAVEKRIDAVEKRIDGVDKRIDSTNDYVLGLMAGIFILIGFMLWDRRTLIDKAKKEMEVSVEKIIEERISKKADKVLLDKILDIIEKLAKDDKETQELLKKHRMNFA